MSAPLPPLVVIGHGLIYLSICTSLSDPEEVATEANLAVPTGITSRWRISTEPTFNAGEANPCPCESDPARRHFLLSC